MISKIRMPENFKEFLGTELMSNWDRKIVKKTELAIKGQELFSRYAGWNFNGKCWFENDIWHCEVWVWGFYRETFSAKKLPEIMKSVSKKYGEQ